jgi:hypothetical protein
MSKPIHLLRRGECRFAITPHSAPSHLFCAESVEKEGAVYCACHAALCYDRRPAEKRRADAERAANMRMLKRHLSTGAYAQATSLRPAIDEDAA